MCAPVSVCACVCVSVPSLTHTFIRFSVFMVVFTVVFLYFSIFLAVTNMSPQRVLGRTCLFHVLPDTWIVAA